MCVFVSDCRQFHYQNSSHLFLIYANIQNTGWTERRRERDEGGRMINMGVVSKLPCFRFISVPQMGINGKRWGNNKKDYKRIKRSQRWQLNCKHCVLTQGYTWTDKERYIFPKILSEIYFQEHNPLLNNILIIIYLRGRGQLVDLKLHERILLK
jgi:hypothetical protein